MQDFENEIIGYMAEGYAIICKPCLPIAARRFALNTFVNVYAINIGSYRQTCHCCGTIIKEGRNEYWPELFDPMFDTTNVIEDRLVPEKRS